MFWHRRKRISLRMVHEMARESSPGLCVSARWKRIQIPRNPHIPPGGAPYIEVRFGVTEPPLAMAVWPSELEGSVEAFRRHYARYFSFLAQTAAYLRGSPQVQANG